MHKLAHHTHHEDKILSSVGEIYQTTHESLIGRRVREELSRHSMESMVRIHRSSSWPTPKHPSVSEDIQGIFPLGKGDTTLRSSHLNPQKVAKRAKVLNCEGLAKCKCDNTHPRSIIPRDKEIVHIDQEDESPPNEGPTNKAGMVRVTSCEVQREKNNTEFLESGMR